MDVPIMRDISVDDGDDVDSNVEVEWSREPEKLIVKMVSLDYVGVSATDGDGVIIR
jgi:hypothetical protein